MSLSALSRERLGACHVELQRLIDDVAKRVDEGELAAQGIHDISVACGYRGKAEQDAAFYNGFSKLLFPHSMHNRQPSLAVDVVPYPSLWSDSGKVFALRDFIKERAVALGIRVRHIPWDGPHTELAGVGGVVARTLRRA